MPSHLENRDGVWLYRRRVPKEYAHLDRRRFVKQSTRIKVSEDRSGVLAMQAARTINIQVEKYWAGLASGKASEARARYDQSRHRARKIGFQYQPVESLANGALQEILDRLDKISTLNGGLQNADNVAALLGGVSPPEIYISSLLPAYESLMQTALRDHSPNQLRKWRVNKQRAIKNLISVIGDKPLAKITHQDALDFREWWEKKILVEELNNVTANKDMGRIDSMIKTLNIRLRLGIPKVFSGLRLALTGEEQRQPFDAQYIADNFLKPGALDTLNEEARNVIMVMIETGMRPSEIVNLDESSIVLDSEIPYVKVLPAGRVMKTEDSRREIPLVGVALRAIGQQSKGFPRYRDKSDSLSAAVNKYLDENNLRPTQQHTLYSFRHAFEDRLTNVEAPEKLIANLMGHKYTRPRYGKGPSLALKHRWLSEIAFEVP